MATNSSGRTGKLAAGLSTSYLESGALVLYVVTLATAFSGWLFTSARGWKIAWFFMKPLSMLTAKTQSLLHAIDRWHQVFGWTLLFLIACHVFAALVHLVYYRDGVMRRML